jgi:hypothetical protein
MENLRDLLTGQKQAEEPPKEVGFMDKLHGALGGGPESEKNEGALDKGAFPFPFRAPATIPPPPPRGDKDSADEDECG